MFDMKDTERRMDGALGNFKNELKGLRTGRASASLLENVQVEAYGSFMPLSQVSTVNVPEPRTLSVTVWDKGMVPSVEKAIRDAGLGLNPSSEGAVIRVHLPDLTEERRRELTKIASRYAEETKVAVRNIRRDAMDVLKKLEKDHKISEDEHRNLTEKVQATTDRFVASVDDALKAKEKEIMAV